MIEKLKEKLYSKIFEIDDEDIRKFVAAAFNAADNEFFSGVCSTSGKYHPPENNFTGGIVIHLLKAFEVGKRLAEYYRLSNREKNIVLAGILLHDIKKCGNPWGSKTDYCHGKIASDWLDNFQLKEPDKTQIKNCVRYHMNFYTGVEQDRERAENSNLMERIVQLADLFSAMKEASWLPEKSVCKEDIKLFVEKNEN